MAIIDNVEHAEQVVCEYCGELMSYEDVLTHELTICYWRPSNRRQRELMEQVMHYIEAWLFYQEAIRKTFEAANANRRKPPSPLEERLVSSYDCTSSGRPPKGPAEKIEITIAIIGSVGSGKSTITGHLIYKLGGIYKSAIKRFEENSADMNKCSSKYTWVLEKLKSEREKDTTVGISMWKFESPKYVCTVIDAPGHSDLIKTMIVGTFPADCAVFVVNSTTDFKTGLSRMRDQAFLAFILGIKQIICCCNKMDATIPKYSKDLYDLIKSQVSSHLNDIGYNTKRIAVVPMSGLEGDNLIERSPSNFGWFKGPTFIEAIDNLNNPLRAFKPLRIPVEKVVQKTDETVLLGHVENGTLRAGMKVNIGPVEVSTRVLSVRMEEEEEKVSPEAYLAGSVVEVVIKKCLNLERGCVISDNKDNPAAKVASFISQIYLLENCKLVTEDYEAVFLCHTAQSTVRVSRILSKVNYKTGAKMENNPTNLKSGEAALVELITATLVVVERVSDYPTLGRFVLTDTGRCVAIGVIKNVEKYCVQVGAEKKTKTKKK